MTSQTLAVAALALCCGLLGLAKAALELRVPYRIVSEDPTPIRDLPGREGAVEILGRAVPDDGKHVEAPFSGAECLAYEYEVQERQSSGQSNTWQTLDQGIEGVTFQVEDDTGATDQFVVSDGTERWTALRTGKWWLLLAAGSLLSLVVGLWALWIGLAGPV